MKNLIEIIKKYSSYTEIITKETKFSDLNIDSLNFVAMITDLEDLYGITLNDEDLDFTLYENVNDLIEKFIN